LLFACQHRGRAVARQFDAQSGDPDDHETQSTEMAQPRIQTLVTAYGVCDLCRGVAVAFRQGNAHEKLPGPTYVRRQPVCDLRLFVQSRFSQELVSQRNAGRNEIRSNHMAILQ
jgi:hypothetical protein